ncbi:hypothetical protein F4815DRAFT_166203 [Daldinia loculata]|nr:hypothetical protein F4815DRAFT_166203 [Daldinia loculata]
MLPGISIHHLDIHNGHCPVINNKGDLGLSLYSNTLTCCSSTPHRTPISMVGDERPRSFGIGGAGNIRTREEAIVHDMGSISDAMKRRRSSHMSLGSVSEEGGEVKSSKFSTRFKSIFSSHPKSSGMTK